MTDAKIIRNKNRKCLPEAEIPAKVPKSSRVKRKSKAFEKWQKKGFFCECVWRAGREWRSLLIIATKNRLKSKIGGNGRVNCLETKF